LHEGKLGNEFITQNAFVGDLVRVDFLTNLRQQVLCQNPQ
jgi:hypothetical protein